MEEPMLKSILAGIGCVMTVYLVVVVHFTLHYRTVAMTQYVVRIHTIYNWAWWTILASAFALGFSYTLYFHRLN
jgi:hypothetical protein